MHVLIVWYVVYVERERDDIIRKERIRKMPIHTMFTQCNKGTINKTG